MFKFDTSTGLVQTDQSKRKEQELDFCFINSLAIKDFNGNHVFLNKNEVGLLKLVKINP